tara:strand:+ start:523 stop:1611 length:1089 start_codon:yes stop_codon:yes gene_type:complete
MDPNVQLNDQGSAMILSLSLNTAIVLGDLKLQAFFRKDPETNLAVSEMVTVDSHQSNTIAIYRKPFLDNQNFDLYDKDIWVKARRGDQYFMISEKPIQAKIWKFEEKINESLNLLLVDYIEKDKDKDIDIDFAELRARLADITFESENIHRVMIKSKYELTLAEFRAMFYSAGSDDFKLAPCYKDSESVISIAESPWGITRSGCGCENTINLNRLGGRDGYPKNSEYGYVYFNNPERNFYAQEVLLSNLEKDLGIRKQYWTISSRIKIEDQLFSLAIVPEENRVLFLQEEFSRGFSDIKNTIVERCVSLGLKVTKNLKINLYINVRVNNGNPKTNDTLIRICYPVRIRTLEDDIFKELNAVV